jgi:Restriction endonuclease
VYAIPANAVHVLAERFFLTRGEFWVIVAVIIGIIWAWLAHRKAERERRDYEAKRECERAERQAQRERAEAQAAAARARVQARRDAELALSQAVARVMALDKEGAAAVNERTGTVAIATWKHAEKFAAVWMEAAGFQNVRLTQPGADEGVDVSGDDVVAQVKFQASNVGRQVVQQLYGVAQSAGKQALFFTSSGYAKTAVQFASGRVALFTYTTAGKVDPANESAKRLTKRVDPKLQGRRFSSALIAEAIAIPDPPPRELKPSYRPRARNRYYNRRRYWR